jgi:hypothetical protein
MSSQPRYQGRWVLIGLALRSREFALIAAFHEDVLILLPELTFFRIANHRGQPWIFTGGHTML